jgi:hypothetical protein
MTLRFLFLIVALVCFVLAALGVKSPRANLTALGLVFLTLAFLFV